MPNGSGIPLAGSSPALPLTTRRCGKILPWPSTISWPHPGWPTILTGAPASTVFTSSMWRRRTSTHTASMRCSSTPPATCRPTICRPVNLPGKSSSTFCRRPVSLLRRALGRICIWPRSPWTLARSMSPPMNTASASQNWMRWAIAAPSGPTVRSPTSGGWEKAMPPSWKPTACTPWEILPGVLSGSLQIITTRNCSINCLVSTRNCSSTMPGAGNPAPLRTLRHTNQKTRASSPGRSCSTHTHLKRQGWSSRRWPMHWRWNW